MSVFSSRRIILLKDNVLKLRNRMLEAQPDLELSHDEILEMFVKPEHREILANVGQIVKLQTGGIINTKLQLPAVEVNIYMHTNRENPGFPLLEYAGQDANLQNDAGVRLCSWAAREVRIRQEWDMVYAVLLALHEKCETAQQMRYFWPQILGLLGMSDDLAPAVDKLRAFKAPPSVPLLNRALCQACKDTALTVTKALLLPAEQTVLHKWHPVVTIINSSTYSPPRCPWSPNHYVVSLG